MKCKDCIHYKNPRQEDWYSVPMHRCIKGNWPYVAERLKKGELTQDQIQNDRRETTDIKDSEKWYNPDDVKFLATRKYGNCDLTMEYTVNNESDCISANASDDHGLEVVVGENFGCIHFKQKEE